MDDEITDDEEPEDYAPDPRDYYSHFFRESERLSTFLDWPEWANVTKEDLAKNGFMYLHVSDRVQCVFCRACLASWSPGDIVANEHRKLCPECPFAFGYECGNIPIPYASRAQQTTQGRTLNGITLGRTVAAGNFAHLSPISNPSQPASFPNRVQQTTQVKSFNGTNTERTVAAGNFAHLLPRSGLDQPVLTPNRSIAVSVPQSHSVTSMSSIDSIHGAAAVITEPKYRDWSDEHTRVRSYRGWPAQMRQTPRGLAAAGLLYMGQGDRCKCYWCGGELYDWDPNDVPWVEHAKWFPQCGFVRQKMGNDFVMNVKDGETTNFESPSNQQFLRRPHVLAALNDYGYTQEQVLEALHTYGVLNLVTAQDIRIYVEELKSNRQAAQVQARLAENASIAQPNFPSQLVNRLDGLVAMTDRGQQVAQPSDEAGDPTSHICREDLVMEGVEESHPDSLTNQRLQNLSLNSRSNSLSSASVPSDVEVVLQENELLKERHVCKICMDKEVCITFLPCRHLATCEDCAKSLDMCPICRASVEDRVIVHWG